MNYYYLRKSFKDIGSAPMQIKDMSNGYEFGAANSLRKLTFFTKPAFTPNLQYFVLAHKAKVTDFIQNSFISAYGFLISQKAKSIMVNFNLPQHIYFIAGVMYHKKMLGDYYWLHLLEEDTHLIDLAESSFYLQNKGLYDDWYENEVEPADFKSMEEFELKDKEIAGSRRHIRPYRLSVKANSLNRDLYIFTFMRSQYIISENLKNALEAEKITGIEILPLDFEFKVI
jgi:hypothetical protein